MTVFDTNVIIYLLEKNPDFYSAARNALDEAVKKQGVIACSVISLAEVLRGSQETEAVLGFFGQPEVRLLPTSVEIAKTAGILAKKQALKLPDALMLATAICEKAELFVTNDHELTKLHIPGLRIRSLTDAKL